MNSLYAPKYYKDFVCIADRCRHSCCIGWEIDVDPQTAEKYEKMTDGYGLEIQKSITKRGTPHFKLKKGDRCPHLDERGLCKIILNLGEDCLCEICREHPRFYNDTAHGKEVGLGLSCEEACRIILSSDSYAEFYEIGEIDEPFDGGEGDFDAVAERQAIYTVLRNSSLSREKKLALIEEKHSVSPTSIPDNEWQNRLSSLEYLDEADRSLFACYSSDATVSKDLEEPLERALAYFIFRHCSSAFNKSEFRAALGFSLFCERLLASLSKDCYFEKICEYARIISEEIEYSEDNTDVLKTEFYFV